MIDTIDAILATGIVILALSLVAQALLQAVKHLFHLKADAIRTELRALFDDGTEPAPRKRRRRSAGPALPDRIVAELEAAFRRLGLPDLSLVEEIGTSRMRQVLKTLPVASDPAAVKRFGAILTRVDCWFEIGREAFRERYQRGMWKWSFGIGMALVIGLNAGVMGIYNDFLSGKAVREALVSVTPAVISTGNRGAVDRDSVRLAIVAANVAALVANHSYHLVRWNTLAGDSLRMAGLATAAGDFCRAAASNWFGWSVSALMISMGAPFWYDFLKMIVGVRDRLKTSAGKDVADALDETGGTTD